MSPLSVGEVFFKAVLLAQSSGASEIGVDTLLSAFDDPAAPVPSVQPAELTGESFFVNSDWIPVSSEVTAAITPFGGFEAITLDALRSVLLALKKNQSDAGHG
jgi:hypothetical protein